MSSTDRISGNYNLIAINGNIDITANGGICTTTIYGNLVVIGTQTSLQSIDTLISDNIITLNASIINGVPILNAGIEVHRGDEPTVALRWTESVRRWQVTSDGSFYSNLMVRVEDDSDPHLGGNLYVNGFEIRSSLDQNIILHPGFDGTTSGQGGVQLMSGNIDANVVLGSTVIYSKAADAGETGIFISNEVAYAQELITKRRALVYALVL